MKDAIGNFILHNIAPARSKYFLPVHNRSATGLVRQVYDQMLNDFKLVPPITVHSSVPKLLAGVWCMVRETCIVGPAGRHRQETVMGAVSVANDCPFCIQAHSAMLHGGKQGQVANSLMHERIEDIDNEELRELARWTAATCKPDSTLLRNPPFPASDVPQLYGAVIAFHYVNRVVNVLLKDRLPMATPFKTMQRGAAKLVGSLVMSDAMQEGAAPGESHTLLPDAELPAVFAWAASNATAAGGIARMSAAVDELAAEIPESVRYVLNEQLDNWAGEAPSISRGWVDQALADNKSEAERSAARLALLTAIASHQVDDSVVNDFRSHYPRPEQLVSVVGWAGFAATRKIASWLPHPAAKPEMAATTVDPLLN